nr:MAG TPA: PlyB like endolysin [Caudoviricetes sp.]
MKNPASGAFPDPYFRENMTGAIRRGIPLGVYHYLCAQNETEAVEEARYFVNLIRPYKAGITLWAAVDVEEEAFLPKDKRTLTRIVFAFCKVVKAAGFRPMVYTNPNYLTYRLNDISHWDLWLAYWGVPEARALRYKPKVWQYGIGTVDGIRGSVDMNRGYFELPERTESGVNVPVSGETLKRGMRVRVKDNRVYGSQRRFVVYRDSYDVLSVSGDSVVIGIRGCSGKSDAVTAAVRREDVEAV